MLHLPLPYRLLQRKMEFDTVLFIRGARCVAGACGRDGTCLFFKTASILPRKIRD